MFTIRFVSHDSPDHYKSYACRAYTTSHNEDSGNAVVNMEFPDGETYYEHIGDRCAWKVAYVTNTESRTIDVVRARTPMTSPD